MNCKFCSKNIYCGIYINNFWICNLCRKKISNLSCYSVNHTLWMDNFDKIFISVLNNYGFNMIHKKCRICKFNLYSNINVKFCINCQDIEKSNIDEFLEWM